jgi:hypothetical protein
MGGDLGASRNKPKGNAWTAADGLDHTWPVTAIAVVAVAGSCSQEEGGLSHRDGRLPVTHTKACAKPNHEQKRYGQFCESSHPQAN